MKKISEYRWIRSKLRYDGQIVPLGNKEKLEEIGLELEELLETRRVLKRVKELSSDILSIARQATHTDLDGWEIVDGEKIDIDAYANPCIPPSN